MFGHVRITLLHNSVVVSILDIYLNNNALFIITKNNIILLFLVEVRITIIFMYKERERENIMLFQNI